MKNLIVETQKTCAFKDDFLLFEENYLCCYNPDNSRYYCIDASENKLIAIDASSSKKCLDQLLYFKKKEKIIAIDYCSVNEEIYIACDSGLIFNVSPESEYQVKCDEIADFPSGMLGMKVSPDHEVIVLLTKDLTVVTLNSNFDILKEDNLKADKFGEKQFITVGWGKKETQFHGSEGKTAAKLKAIFSEKTDTDDSLPKITWKGDGSMFAVSYIDETVNARRFKVFDREGILQYTSEIVDFLESTLAWKPSGNLIASSRKLPNKHTICFFEKNGLLHREFTVPFTTKNILIQDLIWSRNSDVLVVWYKDLDTCVSSLLLYYEKNYHWYQKQTIVYTKENPILYVAWSSQNDKDLLILSLRGSSAYTFSWAISHSQGNAISDKAVVGVIDGNKVLMTCFKGGIVPPPMAQQTLQFKKPVNAISFAPSHVDDSDIFPNDFLALLSNKKIVHCKNTSETRVTPFKLLKTYNINLQLKNSNKYSAHLVQHLFWFKPKIVLCSVSLTEKSSLCELNLIDIDVLDEILVDAKIVQEMPGAIQHIIPATDSKNAYVVVENQLYTYNERDGIKKSSLKIVDESLKKAVLKIQAVKFEDKEAIIALTQKYVLYVDGKQVANNVTSFFINAEFLLMTTLQHTLICFKLDKNGYDQLCTKDLTVQPWESESNELQRNQEISIRRVERGSVLITTVQKESKVILQMPRGNLECIQPRALSLARLGNFIDELEYFKAFDLIRKQRIDLNLLYDHNPQLFLNNVEKFVNDINNPNWLSLFLSDLKAEDVTKTMYISSYGKRTALENSPEKIETVCTSLRTIMEKKTSSNFIQPILISLVKNQKNSGMENALRRIKDMIIKGEQDKENSDAKEALKYLLYMVDVNVLYDIALGMYDFDLVILVAEKSQKDPKEYLPFLEELYNLEENYRKYKIDSHLKRYASAMKHLAKLPDKVEECLAFTQKHELYSVAMKLFKCDSKEYKILSVAYGKYLMSKNKYREAGIMLVKGGNLEEGLNAFKLALNWRDAIVIALKLNLSPAEMKELYEDLIERLVEEKRYDEAAKILSEKLNRFEDAIATLCQGKFWHQAWIDAHSMIREDLIETHIKPGLIDHAEFSLAQLQEHKQNFQKYKNRLKFVREQAAIREEAARAQLAADSDDENTENRGLSDLISETTSIAGSTTTRTSHSSRTSGRTYRSSKNRRKQERKLQSIKEGSVYEDLALIRMLHQLATQAYNQREEIRLMAEMLLYVDSDDLAADLYKLMTEFLDDIRNSKQEIWPSTKENKTSDEDNSLSSCSSILTSQRVIPPNLIEPHLLQPPEEKSSHWKLDLFSVL